MNVREHDLAMALRGAYLALHRCTGAAVAGLGVTADQFVVLAVLAEHGPMTQRDLVDSTSSDPSTMRAMLVLLERKGYVQRRPHPTDGRARTVRLTKSGANVFREATTATQTVRDRMLGSHDKTTIDNLIEGLSQLREAIETARLEMTGRRGAS